MTGYTDWNNVKLMFFIIPFVMMVFFGLLSASKTFLRTGFRKFSEFYSVANNVMSFVFIWIFFGVFFSRLFVNLFSFIGIQVSSHLLGKFFFIFLVILLVPFRKILKYTFSMFSPTLLTSFLVAVRVASVQLKFIYWFYFFTLTTSFIHFISPKKIPPASWIKHETRGRIDFNTLCACLIQPHLSNRIIP